MKKIDWKLIVIIVLALVVVIEGIFLLKKDSDDKPIKNEEKSTVYTNDSVILKVSNDIDVEYEIYNNNQSMLLKFTSKQKNIMTSDITVVFKNANDEVVDEFTTPTGALIKHDTYAINLNVPKITDDYAGNIEITITPEYLNEEMSFYDKSLIKLNHTETNNEDNSITMNLIGTNPFEGDISMIQGLIVLTNKEEIVQVSKFAQNDITSGNEINIDVGISPDEKGNLLKYDNVEIIINELY